MFVEIKNYLINLDNVEMIKLIQSGIDTPYNDNNDCDWDCVEGHLIFLFKSKGNYDIVFDDYTEAVEIHSMICEYLHDKKKLITDEEEWE